MSGITSRPERVVWRESSRFWVVATSNPAPVVGEQVMKFVNAPDPASAINAIVDHEPGLSRRFGWNSIRVWDSSDAFHDNEKPLAEARYIPPT